MKKAIEFVKVDAKDGRPTTEFPARHGPADPLPGIITTHWEPGTPPRYFGLVDDDADTSAPGVLREIPADEWQAATERRQAEACDAIDTAAGEARRSFVSPGWLVEEEYRQTFDAVKAWRDAGSPLDDVPSEIQTAADYEELDIEGGAQSIEKTAAEWRALLAVIRELRLTGKRAVMAASAEEIGAAQAEYQGLLAGIADGQAG